MNKIILVSILTLSVGALGLLTPGCTTTSKQVVTNGVTNTVQVTQLDAQKTADAIAVVLPAGVAFAVARDANTAAYFHAAAIVFAAAVENGQYDPKAIETTLSTISIKELRTPEAKAAIEAGLAIYRSYFGEIISQKLEQATWVKPVLLALAEGIEGGLN